MTQVHLADQVYAETAAVKQQKMPKKKKWREIKHEF